MEPEVQKDNEENLFSLLNIAQLNMGFQRHVELLPSGSIPIDVKVDTIKRLGSMCTYFQFLLVSESPQLGLEEADSIEYGICETLEMLRKYILYLRDDIKTHPVLDLETAEKYVKQLDSEESVISQTRKQILEYLPVRDGRTSI